MDSYVLPPTYSKFTCKYLKMEGAPANLCKTICQIGAANGELALKLRKPQVAANRELTCKLYENRRRRTANSPAARAPSARACGTCVQEGCAHLRRTLARPLLASARGRLTRHMLAGVVRAFGAQHALASALNGPCCRNCSAAGSNSEQQTAKGPRKKLRGRRPKGSPWGPASAKQLQRTAKSNLRIPPVQGELRTSQIM